jgi:peptide chain release factor 1
MLPANRLDAIVARLAAVEAELSSGPDRDSFVKLSREHAELRPVAEAAAALRKAEADLAGVNALLEDAKSEAEMARLAKDEKAEIENRIDRLERELRVALLPKDASAT